MKGNEMRRLTHSVHPPLTPAGRAIGDASSMPLDGPAALHWYGHEGPDALRIERRAGAQRTSGRWVRRPLPPHEAATAATPADFRTDCPLPQI
jgi:hypothetical protein